MSSYAAPQPLDITPLLQAIKAGQAGFAGLPKQAMALANQDVGATVQGIQGQQAQIGQDAAQRAHEIAAASIAAARFLTSLHLGNAISGDYRQAAAAERAAAAGYSGGLQKTIAAAAAPVEANLQRIGAPGHALNVGAQAGNYLYGLGGNLPAERLDIIGPTVAAGYRALPASTVAYGQQQAVGTIGAGQRQAASLNPAILAAEARRSTIAAGYLGKLQAAAETHGQHMFANALGALKLQQADNAASALAAYRQAQIDQAAKNAADLNIYRTGELGVAQTNAATAQRNAATSESRAAAAANPRYDPSTSKSLGYAADQYGNPIVNAKGGVQILPGFTQGPQGTIVKQPAAATPSASTVGVASRELTKDVQAWATGAPKYHYPPGGGTPDLEPGTGVVVPYPQALERAIAAYPSLSRKAVLRIVNAAYPEGTLRPYEGRRAVIVARGFVAEAVKSGDTFAEASAKALKTPMIPPNVLLPMLAKAYKSQPLTAHVGPVGPFGFQAVG